MSADHFSPSTPRSGSWQQYSCGATGCEGTRRIPISPSNAPMTKSLNCELCGSRQRHRAEGSAFIEMIDLKTNPSESPAELLGRMQSARRVKTLVPTADGEDRVWLSRDDVVCASCETLIRPDMYDEDDSFFSILATMKKRSGAAYCPDCHQSGGDD